jgi:hypothetical protein
MFDRTKTFEKEEMLSKENTYQQQIGIVDGEFKRLAVEAGLSEKAAVELWKWYALLQTKNEQ